MPSVQIEQYRATWNTQQHAGLIELKTGGATELKKLLFKDAAEFTAVSTLLACDPDPLLVDDTMITTQVQAPGIALPK